MRVALLDGAGEAVAVAGCALPPGGLEQPMLWWVGVEAAFAALRGRADLSGIGAIAVDGTSGTVLLADRDGVPVGRASPYDAVAGDAAVLARIAGIAGRDSPARGVGSPLARLLERGRLARASGCCTRRTGWPGGCAGASTSPTRTTR